MLTSEELFSPEYCFAGGCSSHLDHPSFSLPASARFSLSLSLWTLHVVSHLPSFPPLPFLPRLLRDDIVLTRLGTCNLFVPRPVYGKRAVLGRCILALCFSLSFFLARLSSVRSQNPFYLFATTRSFTYMHSPRRIIPLSHRRMGVSAPVRNNFFFFQRQTRALHRCTCYESVDASAAKLRIKLRSGLEDAASLVPPCNLIEDGKIRKNMYVVI